MIATQLNLMTTRARLPTESRVMVWDVCNAERGTRTEYPTREEAEDHRGWNETVSPRWVEDDAPPDPPPA